MGNCFEIQGAIVGGLCAIELARREAAAIVPPATMGIIGGNPVYQLIQIVAHLYGRVIHRQGA